MIRPVVLLGLMACLISPLGCNDKPVEPKPKTVEPKTPRAKEVSSARAALEEILQRRPLVLAVGEYHQTDATASVDSTVRRFTRSMLGALEGVATDLVLETWMTTGQCGETEKRVTSDVGETTARPEATEDELVTLLKRAKALGLTPHILSLTCEDYQNLYKDKQVDYGHLLKMTSDKLQAEIQEVRAKPGPGSGRERLVLVYGGAIHNDVRPPADEREYAFGPSVNKSTGGRYVELDLVVPAFVDPEVVSSSDWYPLYKEAVARGKLTLITRGPDSYVLVFPR